jgi:hypothetical protein
MEKIKNPEKWAKAKLYIQKLKGRSSDQFNDQDWLEVKRVYKSDTFKSDQPLEKIMGLSHSMGAPTSEVGGAALAVKEKTEKLKKKLKKKKLNKSDKDKLLLYKAKIEKIIAEAQGNDND